MPEDEDETLSDDTAGASDLFPPRDGRSVSSTLHDRSRSSASSAVSTTKPPATAVAHRSSSKSRMPRASHGGESLHQPRPPPPGFARGENMSSGSSPPAGSARETFLNYFFGQNGPGPIAGSSIGTHHQHQHHSHGHGGSLEGHFVPVGRDVSGGESSMSSGLMAGKRGLDGNNAAYDMKSLGRHIEAVSRKKKSDNFQLLIYQLL